MNNNSIYMIHSLGSLVGPNVTVFVCDWYMCRNCTGGVEQIQLRGSPGWNYVLCEEIGTSLKIEIAPSLFLVGICEVEAFGVNGRQSID